MIIKSFIAEKNISVLNDYFAVMFYGENIGLKDDLKNLQAFKAELIQRFVLPFNIVCFGFLVVPFLMIGRLKQNLFPVITLCSILLLSMIYIPWQFFGAPESSNFLGHLDLF